MNIAIIIVPGVVYHAFGLNVGVLSFLFLLFSSSLRWAPNIFVDDTKENLEKVKKKQPWAIVVHCPTHSKVWDKKKKKKRYLTTAETFKTWTHWDGILYQPTNLLKLFGWCFLFWILQQHPTMYLDVDKAFDGWISFSKHENYKLLEMQSLYEEQGLIYDSWQFWFTKKRMILFLYLSHYLGVDTIFWTANNWKNTKTRFEYWEINDLIKMLGFISICAGPGGESKIVRAVGF